MNKFFILLFFSSFCFFSCKKEKQYSVWSINKEHFSTNEVTAYQGGKVEAYLGSNFFEMTFLTTNLPKAGSLYLSGNDISVWMFFKYDGLVYYPSKLGNQVVVASANRNKAIYTFTNV